MTFKLFLTDLGKQQIAKASNVGKSAITIAKFVVGDGKNVDFSKRLNRQTLVHKQYEGDVTNVRSVTGKKNCYEITCIIPQEIGGFHIREFGLLDNNNKLIWVGNLPDVQKPNENQITAVDYRIKVVVQIDNPDVSLVVDTNIVTATQGWTEDNFVPRSALELIFPLGYPYWTHINKNPKPKFDALFGYETFWRRLEGVHLVAVDDNDPYINQPMQLLGQKGNTEIATARPHVYPIYTSYLFERYDPDSIVSTVWKVKANKTSIDEGANVRFTITANNITDGQILNWKITEGDNNTIDKTQVGTAIMNNGQAIIDFSTTADDNQVDTGKSVKLVISAPANLELTIPINDSGHNETILNINISTNEGLILDEYFKHQQGRYPNATDKIVRFIIAENVDIVAPNTATPALLTGDNWIGQKIIVENHGRILGRGGNGGRGAFMFHEPYSGTKPALIIIKEPCTNGENGGTAIKTNNRSLTIENHGMIAGGGGGGGGGGSYCYANYYNNFDVFQENVRYRQNGTASGGGAPFGEATDNTGSIDWYLNDPRNNDSELIKSLLGDNYKLLLLKKNEIIVDGSTQKLPENHQYRPIFKEALKKELANHAIFITLANATEEQKATAGTLLVGGVGGWSNATHGYRVQIYPNNTPDMYGRKFYGKKWHYNRGGNGGDIGENGEDGQLIKLNLLANGDYLDVPNKESKVFKLIKPAKGGKAGYIYQGNVTIKNIGGGISKGRTP